MSASEQSRAVLYSGIMRAFVRAEQAAQYCRDLKLAGYTKSILNWKSQEQPR